jgi:hypothetical protein
MAEFVSIGPNLSFQRHKFVTALDWTIWALYFKAAVI